MGLEQLAYLAEIGGVILVVATLAFLVIQIQQSTKATRSATSQAIHEHIGEVYSLIVENPDFSVVFVKGMRDPESLSPAETAQFFAYWVSACLAMQNLRAQIKEGIVSSDLMDALSSQFINMSPSAGFQSFWKQRKNLLSAEFRAYMESELFGKSPTEGFKPYYDDDAR